MSGITQAFLEELEREHAQELTDVVEEMLWKNIREYKKRLRFLKNEIQTHATELPRLDGLFCEWQDLPRERRRFSQARGALQSIHDQLGMFVRRDEGLCIDRLGILRDLERIWGSYVSPIDRSVTEAAAHGNVDLPTDSTIERLNATDPPPPYSPPPPPFRQLINSQLELPLLSPSSLRPNISQLVNTPPEQLGLPPLPPVSQPPPRPPHPLRHLGVIGPPSRRPGSPRAPPYSSGSAISQAMNEIDDQFANRRLGFRQAPSSNSRTTIGQLVNDVDDQTDGGPRSISELNEGSDVLPVLSLPTSPTSPPGPPRPQNINE
ncbi:hypothetical protein G7054_g13432 [Neopestalotiopsis clavispora]|nr:hypothetical protein G7054_g13432 [Neopestalotiopsis clavispora]